MGDWRRKKCPGVDKVVLIARRDMVMGKRRLARREDIPAEKGYFTISSDRNP
jgi:hypothetical protein